MSRTVDLAGKRFGKLTVLKMTGEREDRYWTWVCRCDCGNEIIVNTKRLTRGTISHCGCEKKSSTSLGPVPEDLTGKRYGRLTVLRLDKQRENGKSSWLCQCDCGNQCVVSAYSLHYKKRKSCGCLHRELDAGKITDLTNQVFGKLTALYPMNIRDKKGSTLWKSLSGRLSVSLSERISAAHRAPGRLQRSSGAPEAQEKEEKIRRQNDHCGGLCLHSGRRTGGRRRHVSGEPWKFHRRHCCRGSHHRRGNIT